MPEQSLIDRLDDAVEAMLRRPDASRVPGDTELAALWRVAADLVELPRPEFRARLKSDIQRRATMLSAPAAVAATQVSAEEMQRRLDEKMKPAAAPAPVKWKPEGFRSLTPYLLVRGGAGLIDFMEQAFGAEELGRFKLPDGTIQHAEVRIGDSIVELGDGGPAWPARPVALHLYVPDADATYARAVAAGATTLFAPTDRPYGDREADVKDPFGNNWYIGTRQQGGPVPEGMHTVTPTLHVKGTDRLIGFIKEAFGAEELDRTVARDGAVVHAQLKIGDSVLELGEAHGIVEPMPCGIHYYVPDTDAVYARALAAGATSLGPPSDRHYGDRAAEVADPFGNHWYIATHLKDIPA